MRAVQLLSLKNNNLLQNHCHAINLGIDFACKNKSIQNFGFNLTTVHYFFNNSPKRQEYFELLINFYGEKLQLHEIKRRETIGYLKQDE